MSNLSIALLDPIRNPQAWDRVRIGGVDSPGICTLSGFSRTSEFDVKKGKGSQGATLTFVQRPPTEGTIKFQLWLAEHFDLWVPFRKTLKYTPTKKAITAIDIFHPSFADIDLHSVVCKDIGAIEHEGGGLYSISISLIEYFPPPKASAVSTPSGYGAGQNTNNPSGKPDTSAEDAKQEQIRLLLIEAKK